MAKKDLNLSVPTKKPVKRPMKRPVNAETQLDRIERKLDELLSRSAPVTWNMPKPLSPHDRELPPRPPADVWGNPVVYCSACQQRGATNA